MSKKLRLNKGKVDAIKLAKCIALSVFLIVIMIFPSFEAIDLRYRKSVDTCETPVAYQLKAGDIIEQKLVLDKGDRLDDLSVWLSANAWMGNKGSLQITLVQGNVVSERIIDTSQVVGAECVPTRLKLSGFTDGEMCLKLNVIELDADSSVSIGYASGGGNLWNSERNYQWNAM